MAECLTRRVLLSLFGSGAIVSAAKLPFPSPPAKPSSPKALPQVGEFTRYFDAVTELPVTRLTTLENSAFLPARENRAISLKNHSLVFSSDRAGSLSPYRLDLRTGQVTLLTATQKLNRQSLALDAAGRFLFFIEDGSLQQLNLNNKKSQVMFKDLSHFSLGTSAQQLLFIRKGKLLSSLAGDKPLATEVLWCQLRPEGNGCLFTRGSTGEPEELCFLSSLAGGKAQRLAEGPISQPCWSPDGRSALFLRAGALYEVQLDSLVEARIGSVSQFANFSSNADGSVFVGAIRSKAQPTINLLLRSPSREFTLCEHKASHPEDCAPVFSPDSRRVYFNSDFQGKPAIYSVNVESLIEQTSG